MSNAMVVVGGRFGRKHFVCLRCVFEQRGAFVDLSGADVSVLERSVWRTAEPLETFGCLGR